MTDKLCLVVTGKKRLTDTICESSLDCDDGGPLPAADTGAHIGIETPSGAWRQYSLIDPDDAPLAIIAVKREAEGRGGSAAMHDRLTKGSRMAVRPPANNFVLADAPEYLLIAGGIGVTPIHAMAMALHAKDKPFRMIYCARSIGRLPMRTSLQRFSVIG